MVSHHADNKSLSARFRQRRMTHLDQAIRDSDLQAVRLVDLGGTRSFWEMNLQHLEYCDRVAGIDIFNLELESESHSAIGHVKVTEMPGDVTRLEAVGDHEYDIAFSNSVIEHVGNLQQQTFFAGEIKRVAPRFFMQTPNRNFPLEAHFYVPFFPHIPLGVRTWLHRRFRLGWFSPEPDELQARINCDAIRLLTRRELTLLFPGCEIHSERLGGLVKSFIVTGDGKTV